MLLIQPLITADPEPTVSHMQLHRFIASLLQSHPGVQTLQHIMSIAVVHDHRAAEVSKPASFPLQGHRKTVILNVRHMCREQCISLASLQSCSKPKLAC